MIRVADTGIGMALENMPKALAPFGQIDSDFNRRYEGTGIGTLESKCPELDHKQM